MSETASELVDHDTGRPEAILGLWVSAAVAHSGQTLRQIAEQISSRPMYPSGHTYFVPQQVPWLKRRMGPNPTTVIRLYQMEQLERITGFAITPEARAAWRSYRDANDIRSLAESAQLILASGYEPTTVEDEISVLLDALMQVYSSHDPGRVRTLMERRLGVGTGEVMSLTALASKFGVSRERMAQLEKMGLRILKQLVKHVPIACLKSVAAESLRRLGQRVTDVEADMRSRLGSVPLLAALHLHDFLVDNPHPFKAEAGILNAPNANNADRAE